MEEKKSGRYPWGSDENNGEAKEETNDVEKTILEMINSMADVGERISTSESWEGITDDELVTLGAICTWVTANANNEYNNRWGYSNDPDEPDVYYDLVSTKMLEKGLIKQDIF